MHTNTHTPYSKNNLKARGIMLSDHQESLGSFIIN